MVFGILAVVGFIFFIVGIILLVSSIRFQEEAVEVSAEITQIESYRDIDGDISHRVYVTYSYGGKTYENVNLQEYSSGMYEGKEITLLVQPDDLYNVSTGLINILIGGIFVGIGFIFLLICIIALILFFFCNRRETQPHVPALCAVLHQAFFPRCGNQSSDRMQTHPH